MFEVWEPWVGVVPSYGGTRPLGVVVCSWAMWVDMVPSVGVARLVVLVGALASFTWRGSVSKRVLG